MTEREVKARIKEVCDRHGVWWFMPVQTGYGRRGVPDFLICVRGRFVAVEAKSSTGVLSAHQRAQIEVIRAAGGSAWVIGPDNLGELERVLAPA